MKGYLCLLALLLGKVGGAAEVDPIVGKVAIGWRDVSVSGDRAKYSEDINLESGPRLFDANLIFTPNDDNKNWPNLIEIDLQSIGGDPYESIRFDVRKYGEYRFNANHQRSDYFYDDIIVLPNNASLSGSTGGDFHRFEYERVRDNVSLDLQLYKNTEIGLGFERYQKSGTSTTTLDVQRDEFEFERPIDESMQVFRVSASYAWENVSLSLEERIRDYENENSLFLPGFSVGQNSTDLTTLDFLFLDQPYEYRSYEHIVRLIARPSKKFQMKFSAAISELDLEANTTERTQGVDFLGNGFTTDAAGIGEIDREFLLLNFDLKYSLSDRTQLITGLKQHRVEQSSSLSHGSSEGGQSEWDIETTGFHLGVLMAISPKVTLSAGWIGERRNSTVDELPTGGVASLRSEDTDRDGFFGSLDFRLGSRFKLTASVDDTAIDDPFTLASATDSTRFRLRAKYRLDNGWAFVASQSKTERKNGSANWAAETAQRDVRVSYASEGLNLSMGASRVELSRDFERLVTGGFRQDIFEVAYSADTSFLEAKVDWAATDRWRIGASYRAYDNDGSFAVKRDDVQGFVMLKLPQHYALRLSYRNIDFAEPGTEQYDADIVEASVIVGF